MITFRDPPPLPLRVQAVRLPAATTSARPAASWRSWVAGALGVALFATVGVRLQRQQELIDALGPALSNTSAAQTYRLVIEQLPVGTPIARVRRQLDAARVACRRERSAVTLDSTLVCLGLPQVRANVYTRMVLRFEYRAAKLVSIGACPALIHQSRIRPPVQLLKRNASTAPARCWRDPGNVAENEWTYGMVPDAAFTVAAVHATDTTARGVAATPDTLIVHW